MFRNRALQVKVVKTDTKNTYNNLPADIRLQDTCAIIGDHVQRGIKLVGKAIVAYVVVDTLRQVAIAKASQPQVR